MAGPPPPPAHAYCGPFAPPPEWFNPVLAHSAAWYTYLPFHPHSPPFILTLPLSSSLSPFHPHSPPFLPFPPPFWPHLPPHAHLDPGILIEQPVYQAPPQTAHHYHLDPNLARNPAAHPSALPTCEAEEDIATTRKMAESELSPLRRRDILGIGKLEPPFSEDAAAVQPLRVPSTGAAMDRDVTMAPLPLMPPPGLPFPMLPMPMRMPLPMLFGGPFPSPLQLPMPPYPPMPLPPLHQAQNLQQAQIPQPAHIPHAPPRAPQHATHSAPSACEKGTFIAAETTTTATTQTTTIAHNHKRSTSSSQWTAAMADLRNVIEAAIREWDASASTADALIERIMEEIQTMMIGSPAGDQEQQHANAKPQLDEKKEKDERGAVSLPNGVAAYAHDGAGKTKKRHQDQDRHRCGYDDGIDKSTPQNNHGHEDEDKYCGRNSDFRGRHAAIATTNAADDGEETGSRLAREKERPDSLGRKMAAVGEWVRGALESLDKEVRARLGGDVLDKQGS
ncbi:hypothetical protein B0T26DRAFT_752238 [Lasiosphaeria miniovina]|uniref:Uncharacterized protein n=1 Tax=Lasiosphaeria miniovina TaxID=1954250 RepID=A0AA40ALZ3_9PEZI|nr:uncharacterized protein B0T26DRAFT_752238 [Lasiosphaeria miniovina]KAK0718301.1 hypothetical protein B0T26DRAFT_752238 [Lasiosphaeria miniovina]